MPSFRRAMLVAAVILDGAVGALIVEGGVSPTGGWILAAMRSIEEAASVYSLDQ